MSNTSVAAGAVRVAALSLTDASKSFGSVVALSDGKVELLPGEIHGLIGENGAGKSTLVKILAGVHSPDAARFEVDGNPVVFRNVADSKAAGISVIYQEPTLFPDLTVAENIYVGRQPKGSLGLIDRSKMRNDAAALFQRLGVQLSPDRVAVGLSIADQQIIEIAKAISLDSSVLVMDEPTAALSGTEVERLFSVVRSLRDDGAAIMFISHRFDEIFELTDRVTVMRDGRYVATHSTADVSIEALVLEMVGRDIDQLFPKQEAAVGDVVLEVENLGRGSVFRDIDLTVRSGEIVALAGLVGAGRTEVARAVFGVDRYDTGTIRIDGVELAGGSPSAAIDAGIAFVPEDRRKQGLVMAMSIQHNITLTLRNTLARFGLIKGSIEHQAARNWATQLQVKAGSLRDDATTLSGGNQQKVVLAKWLATDPRLLIVDEPTRGIDVGTKAEVHRIMSDLAGRGVAILMISSELPEVIGMADRVLVMREGRLTATIDRHDATPEGVMHAATSPVPAGTGAA